MDILTTTNPSNEGLVAGRGKQNVRYTPDASMRPRRIRRELHLSPGK